jgi:hypothetical protein
MGVTTDTDMGVTIIHKKPMIVQKARYSGINIKNEENSETRRAAKRV